VLFLLKSPCSAVIYALSLHDALPISALLLASSGALAQFRCDCTSIVDTCSAEVVIRGASIEVTADRPQCARVDYFVDGQPFVSRSEEHTSELQSRENLVCRLLLEKKK